MFPGTPELSFRCGRVQVMKCVAQWRMKGYRPYLEETRQKHLERLLTRDIVQSQVVRYIGAHGNDRKESKR